MAPLSNPASTRLSTMGRPPGLPSASTFSFTKSKYGRLSSALPSGTSSGSGSGSGSASGLGSDDGEATEVDSGSGSASGPVQATSEADASTMSAPTAQRRIAPM